MLGAIIKIQLYSLKSIWNVQSGFSVITDQIDLNNVWSQSTTSSFHKFTAHHTIEKPNQYQRNKFQWLLSHHGA